MSVFELCALCKEYLKGTSEGTISSMVEAMLGKEHKDDGYLGIAQGLKEFYKKGSPDDKILRLAKEISAIFHAHIKELLKVAKPILLKMVKNIPQFV